MKNLQGKVIVFILGGWIKKEPDGTWHTVEFEEDAEEVSGFGGRLRVLAAKYLLDEHPDYWVVPSGSKGKFEKIEDAPTLAELMKKELIQLGVGEAKIIKEEKAGTTHQELQELKKIVREFGVKKAIVLSNRYHLARVEAFVEKDVELRELVQRSILEFQEAEEVVLRHDEAWGQRIKDAYESEKMKSIIASENEGIEQIKNSTYKY
ncbi:MAG: YdcF family protein [bacterium]|nr:YdcF family protein [bacterium]MDZ4345019.1 YdcF family protein [Candidatus Binatia bacterium]